MIHAYDEWSCDECNKYFDIKPRIAYGAVRSLLSSLLSSIAISAASKQKFK